MLGIILLMHTYPIPESLSDTYDGEEWALAAVLGGRVVALLYLSDVAPGIKHEEDAIRQWLLNDPVPLLELQQLGTVSVGVINIDGFTELWQVP